MLTWKSFYNRHSGSWALVIGAVVAAAVWYSGAATSLPVPPESLILLLAFAAAIAFNNLSEKDLTGEGESA